MATKVKVHHGLGHQVGETVVDRAGLLQQLLPEASDRSWRCVCFIDCYGNTRFNRLQLGPLLEELDRLEALSTQPEWRALLNQIRSLALLAKTRPQYFLDFIGD